MLKKYTYEGPTTFRVVEKHYTYEDLTSFRGCKIKTHLLFILYT